MVSLTGQRLDKRLVISTQPARKRTYETAKSEQNTSS